MQVSPLDASHQTQSLDIPLQRRLKTAQLVLTRAGEELRIGGPSSQRICGLLINKHCQHATSLVSVMSGSLGRYCDCPDVIGFRNPHRAVYLIDLIRRDFRPIQSSSRKVVYQWFEDQLSKRSVVLLHQMASCGFQFLWLCHGLVGLVKTIRIINWHPFTPASEPQFML